MNKPKEFEVLYIQLEPFKGARLDKAAKEAQEIADELGCYVRYIFNDTKYCTWPEGK